MKLFDQAKEKKILLAAHRGVAGGNIPCNSRQAFQIALNQGADIIELDVESSLDGELFIQHPGMEKVHLRLMDSIKNYPASVVKKFYLSNCDLTRTDQHIMCLEDALTMLKDKCIVNIDKFWEHPEEIAALVRKLHMEDQVIIKTSNKPKYLDDVEKYAPDLPYMAIVKDEDTTYEEIRKRNINYVGVEVVFAKETAPVAQKEYINRMHSDEMLVWANGIVYNYKDELAAGHNDDISLVENPEKGWGWIADKGYDIIQTDFLLPCRQFLEQTGRRRR
ncbi:MAG: glycerophosphodiester phosphodiesterase family protein [Lachnospiraceae bacterium]|nr:glycerophosphodiester phosphodiesterase family protein [Lachnospiraceae bacterium]